MELLKAKTRVQLARKGHKLLKQKRDALVLEFFKILGKAQDLRTDLNARMKGAYGSLAVAQAYHSMQEIESASLAVKRAPGVHVEVRNIMGVRIPAIESSQVHKPLLQRGYGIVGTSAKSVYAVGIEDDWPRDLRNKVSDETRSLFILRKTRPYRKRIALLRKTQQLSLGPQA